LRAEGRFIIDIFNPRLDILTRNPAKRYPHAKYAAPGGKGIMVVTESNAYDDATQINRIKLHYKIGRREEKTDELNMRIFYPQEINALLRYNGFVVEIKYGDYDCGMFRSRSPKQILLCRPA